MRVCGKKFHIFQINNKQLNIKMKAGIQSVRKSWSKSSSFIEFTERSIRFLKKFCLWIWKLNTEVLKMRQGIFALNRAQYYLIPSPLWPHPNPGCHDLNILKSTLPEEASTQVSGWFFWSNGRWKDFLQNPYKCSLLLK